MIIKGGLAVQVKVGKSKNTSAEAAVKEATGGISSAAGIQTSLYNPP